MTPLLREMHEAHLEVRARLYADGFRHLRGDAEKQRQAIAAAKAAYAENLARIREAEAKQREEEARKLADLKLQRRLKFYARIEALLGYGPAVGRHLTMAEILKQVSLKTRISIDDILSARRRLPIVLARHEVMYRCRHETLHSLPRIGLFLGGRDHTTVLNGVARHAKRLAKDG